MRPRLLLVLLLVLVPACTTHKKTVVPPDPDAARNRLAQLADLTAKASYDATYKFAQRGTGARGTVRIRQVPPQYRIDIATKDVASFYYLRSQVISCSQKGAKKACFLVARPGEEIPSLFDPGVQRLFRDAVVDLAAHPADYTVSVVPPTPPTATPAPSPVLANECFLVNRAPATASAAPERAGFENGTYCFGTEGIATLIDVSSGSLTLLSVGAPPTSAAFKPITTVTKLPNLSPTPKK